MRHQHTPKANARQRVCSTLTIFCLIAVNGLNVFPATFKAAPTQRLAVSNPASIQTSAPATNGRIAFASNIDVNTEIFTVNPDGGGRARLTDNPAFDSNPSWSPDGSKIAFTRNGVIHVMNADGSGQRMLNGLMSSTPVAWSPDGAKVAFTCGGVCVADADGGNRKVISSPSDSQPSWSPDGARIAFTRTFTFSNSDIFVMNADGSNPVNMTSSSVPETSPAWSPDGSKIAFTRAGGCVTIPNGEVICFSLEIWVTRADGGGQTFLRGGSVFSVGTASQPAWSPDGAKIAYLSSSLTSNDLFVMNANGGSPVNITNTLSVNESAPSWQPLGVTLPPSIDDPQFFARQHYLDFLNREPDAAGLAFWTGEISGCGGDGACVETKRVNVSAAFFLSIEFQQTGYLVYRLHQVAFNTGEHLKRADFLADTLEVGNGVVVGQAGWEQKLEANKRAFADAFVSRPAFAAQYPSGMTAAQFVDALNANTVGSLSQAERDTLVNELGAGTKTRAEVLRAVAEDGDFAAREFNRAFVLMQYFGYLRRNPNDAPDTNFSGYDFWLTKLNQFKGNFVQAEMVKAFISSSEYRQRFGQ